MKSLRVMMLVHSDLVPPDDLHDAEDPRMKKYITEYDVKQALLRLGHEVRVIGVYDDISAIRKTIEEWDPHIAFNLIEDFAGYSAFDYYVVSYLDMVNIPYTGCHPRGLILARDKALSKKVLSYHRIKVPQFYVFPFGKKIRKTKLDALPYPMVVKTLIEQGSYAISRASYVVNAEELLERVNQLHKRTQGDVIVEQYIEGRELYVSVIGNQRLEVLPIRELTFGRDDHEASPKLATYKVKWDTEYRERWQIDYEYATNLNEELEARIKKQCKRIYRLLDLSGYARMDLRISEEGKIFFLEANPNPAIAHNEDVAFSAYEAGYTYEKLIQKLLSLGLSAHKARFDY